MRHTFQEHRLLHFAQADTPEAASDTPEAEVQAEALEPYEELDRAKDQTVTSTAEKVSKVYVEKSRGDAGRWSGTAASGKKHLEEIEEVVMQDLRDRRLAAPQDATGTA